MQPSAETSEDIARKFGLANIELEYTEEDFVALTNYKLFRQHIQPLLAEQNPKAATTKLVTLIAAKWKEFAAAAGQWKKTTTGLTSPTAAKEGFGDSLVETPAKMMGRCQGSNLALANLLNASSFLQKASRNCHHLLFLVSE